MGRRNPFTNFKATQKRRVNKAAKDASGGCCGGIVMLLIAFGLMLILISCRGPVSWFWW